MKQEATRWLVPLITTVMFAAFVVAFTLSILEPTTDSLTLVDQREIRGKVVSIVEGDVIEILAVEPLVLQYRSDGKACTKTYALEEPVRIRLYGIDCPDPGQPFNVRARQRTAALPQFSLYMEQASVGTAERRHRPERSVRGDRARPECPGGLGQAGLKSLPGGLIAEVGTADGLL